MKVTDLTLRAIRRANNYPIRSDDTENAKRRDQRLFAEQAILLGKISDQQIRAGAQAAYTLQHGRGKVERSTAAIRDQYFIETAVIISASLTLY